MWRRAEEGYDGTEGVEEQVTKEMKEALEGNGFIKGTIEMATRAAMAVMKGEVFEGTSGELTEDDKRKIAECWRNGQTIGGEADRRKTR